MLWPSAKPARVTLSAARCRILLPVLTARDDYGKSMGEPETAPTLTWTSLQTGAYQRQEFTDPSTGEHVLTITDDSGTGRLEEIGLTIRESTRRTFRIRPDNPASAALETEITCSFGRGPWTAVTRVRGRVSRDRSQMLVLQELEGLESARTVYARQWREPVHLP